MRVHEDHKVILLGFPEDLNGIVDPFLIVDARALCFYGFPGEDVSDSVVAAIPETLEMDVRVLKEERSADEGDVVAVEEALCDAGGEVWFGGELCVCGGVDAAEGYLAVVFVFEVGAVDG